MSRVESKKKKHVPHPVGLSIDDFRLGMQCFLFLSKLCVLQHYYNQW